MEEKDISPIISIVMVVYNAVQTIEDTIISVISQLQEVAEFVVVDGCSTDGTQQIIEKYISKIAKYKSEPDTGIYDAMNKSLSMCQGQYIYFIGADDILIDNTIINVLPYLTGNRVIYGNVIFKLRNKVYDGYFNMLKIVTRNISHQSIFYPKKVFLKYEFNTNYRIFADYDLNLKCANYNCPF
jgi:glycosyltransferase involved in cell wall biosynthesis